MRLSKLAFVAGLAFSVMLAPAVEAKAVNAAAKSESPRDIGVGDPLRPILLDTLRPKIEKDLGQKVKFVVRTLRKQNRWAYVVAVAQKPNGEAIDFMATHYADYVREGMFDSGDIYALLESAGGAWKVRDFVIGPTDVYYAGWPDEFGAPYALFKLPKPES